VPVDEPPSTPSRRSSSRAVPKLSASSIEYAARMPDRSAIAGTKSSPMPSTAHEPASPITPLRVYSARIEPTGSASTNAIVRLDLAEEARQAGQRARRADADDDRVDAWPVCCQISGRCRSRGRAGSPGC
jgi:hypothetical protein